MKKILLLGILTAVLCSCSIEEIKDPYYPPSVQPGRAYVQEYNPKKAGAEITGRFDAAAGDNITLYHDKLFILSGSSKESTVTVYDISHSQPTFIYDLTFDVSEVMPPYHYESCKCLIPYNNKMLMLLSLDGTADCNMFFSINDDGSEFKIFDVSKDIPDLSKVYSANYFPADHILHLYNSYKVASDTRYLLYEYLFDEINDRFILNDFYSVKSPSHQNDGYQWSMSAESCGYTIGGEWLSCAYITITSTADYEQSYKIYYGYLDLAVYYDHILMVFSIDDDIFLYTYREIPDKYEFLKLRMLE